MGTWPTLLLYLLFVQWTTTVDSFNLTILHINDIHCRFEEANKFGGACSRQDSANGKCFGGYARLVHQSREIRNQHANTIFVSAGDFYQGTM